MSQANLDIVRISGHAGPVPGEGLKRGLGVAKLIDTTTCIGCKACEVACLEWNGLSFSETTFQNSYQTMPETAWNFWNLIKFDEYEPEDGGLMLLMRKDQCMHCGEPGCLIACPADGAIVQYANGIVDFNQDQCIGCGYCITGCLHFGTKAEMLELGENRALQLREESGFAHAGVYNPSGVGGTHVLYVLHDATNPEAYGGLPKDPHVPWTVWLWKRPLKWIGNLAMAGGLIGMFVHFLRFGPKVVDEEKEELREGKEP